MLLKKLFGPFTNLNTYLLFISRQISYAATFKSQTEYARISIKQPEPGKWFAIGFKSYLDPKDHKITQKGFSKKCTTYASGNLSLKYAHPTFITSDKLYQHNFVDGFRLYKFYNPTSSYICKLFLKLIEATDTNITISTWSKATPEVTKNKKSVLLENLRQITFVVLPKTFNYLLLQINSTNGVDLSIFFKLSIPSTTGISEANYVPLIKKSFGDSFSFDYMTTSSNQRFQGSPVRVTFRIEDLVDTGGTLTIRIAKEFSKFDPCLPKLVICLTRDIPSTPLSSESCLLGSTKVALRLPILPIDNNTIHIPYPESGQWFLSFDSFCQTQDSNSTDAFYNLLIFSSHCIAGGCGDNGKCEIAKDAGILYSYCFCFRRYTGWDCSNDSNIESAISPTFPTLWLTLSNLFFVLSVGIAIIRGLYTEAIVYFFGMLSSITYHTCDQEEVSSEFCYAYSDFLQFADFYCSFLAIWMTTIAMANLPPRFNSIAHICGTAFIAFGTYWDKLCYLVALIPASLGILLVILSWINRCCKFKRLFPSKMYLAIYLPIGAFLVTFGLICNAMLQTERNYYMVHSAWHMLMALSILFLLPGKRALEVNLN